MSLAKEFSETIFRSEVSWLLFLAERSGPNFFDEKERALAEARRQYEQQNQGRS